MGHTKGQNEVKVEVHHL